MLSSFFSSLTVKESEAQRGGDFLKYVETETPESKLSAFCPDSVPQQTTAKCPHDGLSGLEEDRQETVILNELSFFIILSF